MDFLLILDNQTRPLSSLLPSSVDLPTRQRHAPTSILATEASIHKAVPNPKLEGLSTPFFTHQHILHCVKPEILSKFQEFSYHGAAYPTWLDHRAHSPKQVVGLFIPPIEVVLGLKGWNDTLEWVNQETLFSYFDIEKMIRMFLHGSLLIYDYLIAAAHAGESFAIHVLDWTVNERHLQTLHLATQTLEQHLGTLVTRRHQAFHLQDEPSLYLALRRSLQFLLLKKGILECDFTKMITYHIDRNRDLSYLERTSDLLLTHDASTFSSQILPFIEWVCSQLKSQTQNCTSPILPSTPKNYAALSRWLVQCRLEETICTVYDIKS